MVSVLLALCVGLPESVTVTVTVVEPAVVGVPLTVQPFRINPAGSVPVMEHVYGDVPPEPVMVPLYVEPTVPFGREPVMVSAAGLITIVSFELAF